MSAVRDNSASSCAHQIILYRRDGLDIYACICGARAKVPSSKVQEDRVAILKSFASDHLARKAK
jgi:hypothetical protein